MALSIILAKEAVPIDPKKPRHIQTNGAKAPDPQNAAASGSGEKKKKKSRRHFTVWGYIWRTLACLFCVGIMACSVGGVVLAMYIVQATADDSELDLDNQKLKQTTIVYAMDRDTSEWVEYARFSGSDNRIWVSLEQIPEDLQHAVIAIEDKDFYNEPGINITRTIGAALNEFTGNRIYGRTTGASTIEQQLVKNLTNDNEDSGIAGYMRKVREIFRAIGLCNRYSKETILEAYLNTIPLTGQIYGMEVGANTYFGKTVSELTLSECATLASITNNPTAYNPFTNPENLIQRRNHVLWEMLDQGYITQEEYDAACAESITVVDNSASTRTATVTSNNSYFTDALFEDLTQAIMEEYGLDESAARSEILNGGLQVYSTVDPDMQTELETLMLNEDDAIFPAYWTEQEVSSTISADSEITYDENGMPLEPNSDGEMVSVFRDDQTPVYEDDGVTFKTDVDEDSNTLIFYESVRTQAAAAVVDYDGQVLAVVGGLGEKTNDLVLNRATAAHQTGSTAKPIAAYCLALDNGLITYSSQQVDSPLYSAADKKVLKSQYSYMDPFSAEALNRSDVWRDWPENYGGAGGDGATVLVYDALRQSLNTVAVRIGSLVGAEMMFNFVHDTLQCESLSAESDVDLAPMVLGSQTLGITTVELAAAYTIFYDGTFTTPHYFTQVYDYQDNLYLDNSKRVSTTQAIKPSTATIMNRMLQNVLRSGGTASGMIPETTNDLPAAAKTGTTSDFRDFTFAGLTPYFSMAVWWGYDQPQQMGTTSGRPTQVLWKQFCEAVLADAPYQDFPMADDVQELRFDTSTGSIVSSGGQVGYYTSDNLPESYTATTTDPYAQAAQDAANAPAA